MKNFIETWIAAERDTYGHSQLAAIRELNAALNMAITCSRVSQYRRGIYLPSVAVIGWMLNRMLPWVLERAGLSPSEQQLESIERMLWDEEVD